MSFCSAVERDQTNSAAYQREWKRARRAKELFHGRFRLFNNFGRPTDKVIKVVSIHDASYSPNDGWKGEALVETHQPDLDTVTLAYLADAIHDGVLRKES